MSIFDWFQTLFWRDPTQHWNSAGKIELSLNLDEMSLSYLEMGSVLERAQAFGKPDTIDKIGKNYFIFNYSQSGLILEYEEGKLCDIAIVVGEDEFSPENLKYSTAKVESSEYGNFELSNKTLKEEIKARFGTPKEIEEDTDEIIFYYELGANELEFEFLPNGSLKRLNIFHLN